MAKRDAAGDSAAGRTRRRRRVYRCSGERRLPAGDKGDRVCGRSLPLLKFPAILLGLLNVGVLNSLSAWKKRRHELSSKEQLQLFVAGGVSLVCWLTAVAAGRMIGYW